MRVVAGWRCLNCDARWAGVAGQMVKGERGRRELQRTDTGAAVVAHVISHGHAAVPVLVEVEA